MRASRSALRNLGFSEDSSEGAPICRWLIDHMKLDVMPTDETILGFSNRWYKPAIEAAAIVAIDGFELRVVTTPYFIGTKLEAFRGRGKGDFYASSDLEDIITVLDGRPTVVEEVADSPRELRRYIGKEVGRLLDNREFVNALPEHTSLLSKLLLSLNSSMPICREITNRLAFPLCPICRES